MPFLFALFTLLASAPAWAGVVPLIPAPMAVPEPATLALLAAGVGAIAVARRRRK